MSTFIDKSRVRLGVAVAVMALVGTAGADVAPVQNDKGHAADDTSPVLKIERRGKKTRGKSAFSFEYRSVDGSDNNLVLPQMNASEVPLERWAQSEYSDLAYEMAGANRPSPRHISNALHRQSKSFENPRRASDYLWQWGQFLDHDLDLTDGVAPAEPSDIPVPSGDPWFDPAGTGAVSIRFNRSIYDKATGTGTATPRQQLNEITGWIDASNVYGSDAERAAALRVNDGSGRLRTSAGNLLPFNVDGLANAGGSGAELFLAGDVRANEQVGLTALHTLFVREHNRLARQIARRSPGLSGDDIYQRARRIVGAQMQVITYREFLPLLVGRKALRPYRGYVESADAGIANMFSAAAYRLGHSMLSSQILRLDARGRAIPQGHLALRDAFFTPATLVDEGGLEPILRGLAGQVCQRIDAYVVDDVRNFLFGPPGAGGFDLASLNIQRGRDHGLPNYNAARMALGLAPVSDFSEITSDAELQQRLAEAYPGVEDMDMWSGGLAEDPVRGSMLGALFHTVVVRQFELLRDGDRFWYQRALSPSELKQVRRVTLAQIIRRNTEIGRELPNNVFLVSKRKASNGTSAPSQKSKKSAKSKKKSAGKHRSGK